MSILALVPAPGDEPAAPTPAMSRADPVGRQCYLPWCSNCYGPNLDLLADTGHMHTGAETRIDVQSRGRGGKRYEEGQIRFWLERYDEDTPGAPETGYTHVYLAIGDSEGVAIPFATARMFVRTFLGQIEAGEASRHLVNRNEADSDEQCEAEHHCPQWT